MARIPEAEVERLKNEISVERLVEAGGIELKKSGNPSSTLMEPKLLIHIEVDQEAQTTNVV